MSRTLGTILLIVACLSLNSCGGGNRVAEGGIGGTGISVGRVAQVGSVYVNGLHFNTDAAQFVVNGDDTKTLNDIDVGMVVRVTGTKDTATASGTAQIVEYSSNLTGPVETDIDANHHRTIMGQQVQINPDTVFENSVQGSTVTLDTLQIDDLVDISGFRDGVSGEILATRVELISSPITYRVIGKTTLVNTNTFAIGALHIQLNGQSMPASGSYVKVTSSSPPAGGVLIADTLSVVSLDGSIAADGETVEIEGIIASGLDANDHFVINGQTVDASLTSFSGDTTSLAAGRIVEVAGVMDGSILLAEEIELEATSEERQEIAALLESGSVDTTAATITLLGQVIQTDNDTIFENDTDEETTFTLSDLQVGDYLEAKVYDNNSVLTATKLELEDPPTAHDAELEGIPSFVAADQIRILNVLIDTSAVPGYDTSSTDRIEVKGNYVGGIVEAIAINPAD
jgi:hypothetical protein